jgi:hypothetical protein
MKGSGFARIAEHYWKILVALLLIITLLVMGIALFNGIPGFNAEIPPIFGGASGQG